MKKISLFLFFIIFVFCSFAANITVAAALDLPSFLRISTASSTTIQVEKITKCPGYPELYEVVKQDINSYAGPRLPYDAYMFISPRIIQQPDGSFSGTGVIDRYGTRCQITGTVNGNSITFTTVITNSELYITQKYAGIRNGDYITGTFREVYNYIYTFDSSDASACSYKRIYNNISFGGTFSINLSEPDDVDIVMNSAPEANGSMHDLYFSWDCISGNEGYYYQLDNEPRCFTTNNEAFILIPKHGAHMFSVAPKYKTGNVGDKPAVVEFNIKDARSLGRSEDAERGIGNNESSVGDPINVTTGNMYVVAPDLTIPGKGLDFSFTRTYNSREQTSGPLGYGWTHSYNIYYTLNVPHGNIIKIKDEEGKGYVFVYDDVSGICFPQLGEHSTLVKDANGHGVWTKKNGKKYIFNSTTGKLLQVIDRWGNTVTLTYDTQGQLVDITDTAGRQAELRYDAQGRISSLSMAGRMIEYRYDNQGNLTYVTDPANNHTSYEYDANHNLTRKVDSRNKAIEFTYDAQDRCTSSIGEGNLGRTELSFDPAYKKTVVTDSKGKSTEYYYNDDFQITEIINAQDRHTVSTWDNDLNRTSRTDELGRVTNMQYDAKGNLTKLTDPAGNNTTYTYEPNFSLVTAIRDAQGNITTNAYDAKGNLTKVTDALGKSTFYSYNAAGQVTGSQNALGKTTYFTYDAQGNLTQTKDAVGAVINNGYDAVGNMTSSKDPKGSITNFSYDNLNRITQTTYSDNSTVSYGYDTVGNRTSAVDQLGKTTYYTYDQAGKVISTTNALGGVINYTYDTEENLAQVADQNNNKTSYSYDGLNRLTSQTDALGNTTSYSYDAVGNRTSVTDAKGQVTRYDYDNLNRLVKTTNPDSTTITYVYDSLGRRTSMTDSSGITTYAYDKLGRLLKVDGPLAKDTLTYTYDAMGNRLTMIDPDAKTTKYAYDALNRIISITDPQNKITTYLFDLNGNLTTLTYPNGTRVVYSYDKLNHLTKLTNQKTAAPNTKLSEYTYVYDLAGRKTRVALSDGSSITYTYDAVGQLTQETSTSAAAPYSFTYTYDPAGNRTRKTVNHDDYNYSYNSLNQLIQEDTRILSSSGPKKITVSGKVSDKSFVDYVTVNGIKATLGSDAFTCANVPLSLGQNTITVIAADVLGNTTTKVIHVTYEPGITTTQTKYTYDRNGNLTTKEEQGQTASFAYDSQNRLISFNSPGLTETYQYDSEGRRTSVRNTSATTTYLYDGMSVILERNAAGATTASYLINPLAPGGIGGIISSTTATQNYYHYDGIGTVTVLSNTSGASTQTYSYDAFGNVLSQSGTVANNRNFLTKQTDSTGLIFFGARYYDPRIGRFISRDPSGMTDGPNLYVYCRNDPINYVDLWGLCKKNKSQSIWDTIGSYISMSLSYSVLGQGQSFSGNSFRNTVTIYNLVGASVNINIGWLPSSRDMVTEMGLGLGGHLGISHFYGRPNARGDFEVGGLTIHIGLGLGTPVYIGNSFPSLSTTRNIPTKDLYYEQSGGQN